MVDAYVITDRPDEVADFIRAVGVVKMSAHVAREVALIVNPSAGGGRAARALPAVEARLRALGVGFEVDATRDIDHARELAVGAAQRGRVVGDPERRRDARRRRRARCARCPGAVVGVLPGGRGNDFARVVGIPLDAEAACDVIANGVARPIDLGLAGEHAVHRDRLGRLRLGGQPDRQLRARAPGPARLRLRRAGRAGHAGSTPRFTVDVDGERTLFAGWSVAAANSKAYGGGMFVAPDAELDDGALDVVYCERTSKATFVRKLLPKVFKGEHVNEPSVHVLRGAEVRVDADRPFMVYADGDPVGELPMTFRALPARAAGAAARMNRLRRQGRRPRAPPARCRAAPAAAAPRCRARSSCASSPTPSRAWALGCERGSAVISATNGKTTTAAMVAGILERAGAHLVHNRAGANMAGGVAAALMAGPPDGDTGLFEVDEFWLGQVVDELRAARAAAGQPVPRPARPLRRARLDRRSLGGRGGAAPRPRSSSTPTIPPSPTWAATSAPLYFGVQDDAMALPAMQHAADATHCRRCGAPYRYDAIYLGHLGPLPLRQLRRDAPRPAGLGPRHRARGRARRALHAAHAGRARARSRCPCPGSTTSTTPSARPLWRSRSERRSTRSTPACTPSPPPSGAPRRCAIADRDMSILLVKNPAGANEVLRTLDARGRRARRLRRAQRQHRRRARRQLGVGRRLRGPRAPRAPRDVQRHPRGRDGAAAEVRRRPDRPDRRRARARGRPGPRPGRTATARSSPCPPTPRCSRCATCSSRAAPCTARSRDRGPLARPRVRRLRPRPAAVARAGRPRGLAGPRRRRRDRARRARPRPPRPRGRRARPQPGAARRPARARRGPRRSPPSRPTRATFAIDRRFPLVIVPMQTLQLLGGADGRARFLGRAREHLAPGGLLAVALADALESFDEEHDQPPPPDLREVGGVVYASRPVSGPRPRRPRRHRSRARDRRDRRHAHDAWTTSSSSIASSPRSSRTRRPRSACAPSRRAASRRRSSTWARRW